MRRCIGMVLTVSSWLGRYQASWGHVGEAYMYTCGFEKVHCWMCSGRLIISQLVTIQWTGVLVPSQQHELWWWPDLQQVMETTSSLSQSVGGLPRIVEILTDLSRTCRLVVLPCLPPTFLSFCVSFCSSCLIVTFFSFLLSFNYIFFSLSTLFCSFSYSLCVPNPEPTSLRWMCCGTHAAQQPLCSSPSFVSSPGHFQGLCSIQICASTPDGLQWCGWHWCCIATMIQSTLCSVNQWRVLSVYHITSYPLIAFIPFPFCQFHPFTTQPTSPLFRATSVHLGLFQTLIGWHPSNQLLTPYL